MEKRSKDPDCKEGFSKEMPLMKKFRGRRRKPKKPVKKRKDEGYGVGLRVFLLLKFFEESESSKEEEENSDSFIEEEGRSPTRTGETGGLTGNVRELFLVKKETGRSTGNGCQTVSRKSCQKLTV